MWQNINISEIWVKNSKGVLCTNLAIFCDYLQIKVKKRDLDST